MFILQLSVSTVQIKNLSPNCRQDGAAINRILGETNSSSVLTTYDSCAVVTELQMNLADVKLKPTHVLVKGAGEQAGLKSIETLEFLVATGKVEVRRADMPSNTEGVPTILFDFWSTEKPATVDEAKKSVVES